MKMKTSELKERALDYCVAKGEGWQTVSTVSPNLFPVFRPGDAIEHRIRPYSTDWSQGGPLIERESIDVCRQYALGSDTDWVARLEWLDEAHGEGFGPTPLIAACRCFVASTLGDEVEVPSELT